jgi:hypothetical protein
MVTAEKYFWGSLFNAAMDSFRQGEYRLNRPHPVARHVDLAYAFCPRDSPLVRLLADVAFFSGMVNCSQNALVDIALRIPEFQGDLMLRERGAVVVPGWAPGSLRLSRGPLAVAGPHRYHVHYRGTEMVEKCPKTCEGGLRPRTLEGDPPWA